MDHVIYFIHVNAQTDVNHDAEHNQAQPRDSRNDLKTEFIRNNNIEIALITQVQLWESS